MAVREYIGARYVPILGRVGDDTIVWDSTKAYEALTIVTHNGDSFTSRQDVPVGIDINNTTYWAETGNYNAQIEAYRQEVRRFDARITQNADDIAQEILDRAAADSALSDRITTNAENLAQEVLDRAAADDNLSDRITTNAENLAQEVLDRAAADDDLSDRITANANRIDSVEVKSFISADAIGCVPNDPTFDNASVINDYLDENPEGLFTIMFRKGIYYLQSMIHLNGDINGVDLDLNGCVLRWSGEDYTDWIEGDATETIAGSNRLYATPGVMIGIERKTYPNNVIKTASRTSIRNGIIDCDYKAGIAIQSCAFVSHFENLRIHNFQYVGIMIGNIDRTHSLSAQNEISNCYFNRGSNGDISNWENAFSHRPYVSAIFIGYPDNNIVNCITNRTKYGITFKCGGNSIANTHITIQYDDGTQQYINHRPNASNYDGASVRLWVEDANKGHNEVNLFTGMYFNMGLYAFETYQKANQSVVGSNLKTVISNSMYIFYTTADFFSSLFRPVWYGGSWYGACICNECAAIYGDRCQMLPYVTETGPSIQVARANEMGFTNFMPPHSNSFMFDLMNFCNDETIICTSSDSGIPAGKYKRVAVIATVLPVGTFHIPGKIRYEYSHENGGVFKSGTLVYHSGGYAVTNDTGYGTTSLKMYISNASHELTFRGKTFYLAYINFYNSGESAISDARLLTLKCDSPYVDVYAFPDPTNFTSGSNQNIFDTAGTQVEVF